MRDPKDSAIELLEARGQRDAARILERCNISIRQLDRKPTRLGEGPPLVEMLIHAPKELAGVVHGDAPSGGSQSDWGNRIERALRDAAERDDVGVLVIQWVETGAPNAGPGAATPGPAAPRRSSGGTPGRGAGQ